MFEQVKYFQCRSFSIPNLKSTLTNKPKIIKKIPKYELKDRSKKLIKLLHTILAQLIIILKVN